jgi:phosphinothricin acetyltransferase
VLTRPRQGLGSLLINELINYANNSNIDNFIAEIASDNIQSINFHKKHGFKQCGILNDVGVKGNSDFSIIYMQKRIQ